MRRNSYPGQSVLEFAVTIAIVAAALLAISIFFLRAVQGKYRESADVFGQREQYTKGGVTVETNLDALGSDITFPPPGNDPCPGIVARVNEMEENIARLNSDVASLEHRADDLEAQAQQLAAMGVPNQQLLDTASQLREQAGLKREEINRIQEQINNYRSRFPSCF